MIVFTPYLAFYFTVTSTYSDITGAPPMLRAIVGLIVLLPPIIIAYSMLRYRLLDIDVVIRKRLV